MIHNNVVAGMATAGKRESLYASVTSIASQVRELYVYVNCKTLFLNEKYPSNVKFVYDENLGDIGDLGKFFPKIKENEYLATVDDDIIYPEDYIKSLLLNIKEKSIAGVHGIIFNFPIFNYYTRNRNVIHFEKSCEKTTEVDVIGTGTSLLPYELISTFDLKKNLQFKNMADIAITYLCNEQGFKKIVIPRKSKWLKEIPSKNSIFASSVIQNQTYLDTSYLQTGYINNILNPPKDLIYSIPVDFSSTNYIHYLNNYINKLDFGIDTFIVSNFKQYLGIKIWPIALRLISEEYLENKFPQNLFIEYDFEHLKTFQPYKAKIRKIKLIKKRKVPDDIGTFAELKNICLNALKEKILEIDLTDNSVSLINSKYGQNLIKNEKLNFVQIYRIAHSNLLKN